MRKIILLAVLSMTMTGCAVNVVVAPHATLMVDSNDAGTLQVLHLPDEEE